MLTNIQPLFIVLRTQREVGVRGPCARRSSIETRKVIKKELTSWQLTDPLIHRKAITDHSFEWLIKSTICQRKKKRIIISYWSNCKRRVVSCGHKDEYTFFPFSFFKSGSFVLYWKVEACCFVISQQRLKIEYGWSLKYFYAADGFISLSMKHFSSTVMDPFWSIQLWGSWSSFILWNQ